jgi:indolepyruvate decarboxylase
MEVFSRYDVPAIVIVLDNEGYGTERPMLDGAYNDVQAVDHVMLAKAYGFKAARRATTELEMFDGLQELDAIRDGPTLLSVSLDKFDSSNALKNLTANLKKQFR